MRDIKRARQLRGARTEAEQRLWQYLRGRRLGGLKFRRQHPILDYFVDFYCAEHGLVVELDGSQHLDRKSADASRSMTLEHRGLRVLRFWNDDVLARTDEVLSAIIAACEPHGSVAASQALRANGQ
jgi:adenine-specific DNA-methyltransferase